MGTGGGLGKAPGGRWGLGLRPYLNAVGKLRGCLRGCRPKVLCEMGIGGGGWQPVPGCPPVESLCHKRSFHTWGGALVLSHRGRPGARGGSVGVQGGALWGGLRQAGGGRGAKGFQPIRRGWHMCATCSQTHARACMCPPTHPRTHTYRRTHTHSHTHHTQTNRQTYRRP